MSSMKEHSMPVTETVKDEMGDTRMLQKAIEKIVDDDTMNLPHQEQLSDAVEKHTDKKKHRKKSVSKVETFDQSQVNAWFFTFMCMNIPVIGWIYLMYLAFNKKQTDRRNFARAYLFYKLVFLVVGLVIIVVLGLAAVNLLDQLLAYMQML